MCITLVLLSDKLYLLVFYFLRTIPHSIMLGHKQLEPTQDGKESNDISIAYLL
jgi:hypothetical protein